MAERAGYTVTMFLVDVSRTMGKTREVEIPSRSGKDSETIEMTNLEWSIQFVMLKIQEMIFNGRKTDKCGVILFGSDKTKNMISEKNGGYENVEEYIPIAQPTSHTLAKLSALQPTTEVGDPLDALIVGVETQHAFLGSKKSWTRKIVLLTDGENPIEIEDWEATTRKMNELSISLTVVGVDFDDDEVPFKEEGKSEMKKTNEEFYHTLVSHLDNGVVGNCDYALQEISRPDIKQTKSTLMGTVLRLGDTQTRDGEAIEIIVKTSKCTALARPKSWKKFARRKRTEEEIAAATQRKEARSQIKTEEDMDVDGAGDDEDRLTFAQLKMRTEYYIEQAKPGGEDAAPEEPAEEEDEDGEKEHKPSERAMKLEKEELVRGFKYGASYAPCPDGQFEKLKTHKGLEICGFFSKKNFRREMAMGEVQYVWADPAQPLQQVALSSIVQAMYEKGVMAIARWVSRDGMDPKMGVLSPSVFEEIDCLLWVQMPFADDVRHFAFASLDTLVSKKGEVIKEHPYLPTEKQMEAMENFVDALDLMDAGEKDEEGNREPWFDTRLSYNPAVHRTKQALFHGAIVTDLNTMPLPPPHPELQKYFEPPRRLLKRAHGAIEECKKAFDVKEVPKKVAKTRKDGHVRAQDDEDDMLLLDQKPRRPGATQTQTQRYPQTQTQTSPKSSPGRAKSRLGAQKMDVDSSATEDEDEEMLLLDARNPLPTPSVEDEDDLPDERDPGRIVGRAYPLRDFRKNVARGDVVTKAVEDLAFVVQDVVLRPFASRRTAEMLECLTELRKTALEEDEIETWNASIHELRRACVNGEPGNSAFWEKVQEVGLPLSLISKSEAAKAGGKSKISEKEAETFIQQ